MSTVPTKRLQSRFPDSLAADAISADLDSRPLQKRVCVDTHNTHYDIASPDASVESKTPTIVETAVAEIENYIGNRLERLKEEHSVWERNGTVPFFCATMPIGCCSSSSLTLSLSSFLQSFFFPLSLFFFPFLLPLWNKLKLQGFVNPGGELPPIADPQLYFLYANSRLRFQAAEELQREEFIGDRIYGASLLQVLEKWRFPRRCISMLFFAFSSNVYQERLFHKWKAPEFLVPQGGEEGVGKTCADAIEGSNTDIALFVTKANSCV